MPEQEPPRSCLVKAIVERKCDWHSARQRRRCMGAVVSQRVQEGRMQDLDKTGVQE